MKRLVAAIGLIALLSPEAGLGLSTSIYQTIYDDAANTDRHAYPSEQVKQFVVDVMKNWQGDGIQLAPDDVKYALEDKIRELCKDKVDMSGNGIEFVTGGQASGQSCLSLQSDILSIVAAEQDADQLGADLLAIADGSELAVANEPQRPYEVGLISSLLNRVWTGTGAGMIPWDGTANGEVQALDGILSGLDPEDLDKAILRFHHGYFRDQREADPDFSGVQDPVGNALKAIADKLHITGDPKAAGEFVVPDLQTNNVGLWARSDDIGILWVYPTRFARIKIEEADQYPKLVASGSTLAYPFSYNGSSPPSDPAIRSPLCSRTMGRFGYLCYPLPPQTGGGSATGPATTPNGIILTKSEGSGAVTTTNSGPKACTDLIKLFKDDGTPLQDPNNPGSINPNLQPADLTDICTPDTKILYQDDISSHACYISHCLIQSMNHHTLVPNRNTDLLNEATSPYLACQRPDPHLGTYMEVPHIASYSFPTYIGPLLTQDFERMFCIQNGNAPHPLAGFCVYRNNRRANSPDIQQVFTAAAMAQESQDVTAAQDNVISIGAIIGERAAQNQTDIVERKIFGSLSAFVDQVTSLFLELDDAKLTKTPCPWTGPFSSSSSSAP